MGHCNPRWSLGQPAAGFHPSEAGSSVGPGPGVGNHWERWPSVG